MKLVYEGGTFILIWKIIFLLMFKVIYTYQTHRKTFLISVSYKIHPADQQN